MGGFYRVLSRSSLRMVVLLLLMASVAGCLQRPFAATPTPSPPPVATPLPPVRGGVGAAATASGKVVPVRQAGLSLAATGRVQEVTVEVGDQVEAGDVLLVLDNAATTAAVAQARAGLLRAQAHLDDLKAGPPPQEIAAAEARLAAAQAHLAQLTEPARPEAIDAARAELAAMQAQYDAISTTSPNSAAVAAAWANVRAAEAELDRLLNPATESQIAEAEAQVQSAQAELDLLTAGPRSQAVAAATAAVAEAEATLQQAEADLAATQLTAPFAGTITSLDINPGEMVQGGQVVMTLADLSRMQVETTDLSERTVVHVTVGQPVTVFIEALNTELAGRVARIAPQANVIGGDVVYAVLVDLDQQPPNLRWGMSAAVEIQAEQEE